MSDEQEMLRQQYADASNLAARSRLHSRFQTNKYGWLRWIFDQFELTQLCSILELGCGNAALWMSNYQRIGQDWDITLSDFSAGMLDEARRNLAKFGNKFDFAVIDAQAIPFENGRFDVVIANHMLYHVADLEKGLGEIRRVLKDGGRLYATTNGDDHMRELREMVKPFAPELPFVQHDNAKAFSLENGAGKLMRYFKTLKMVQYEDSLEVTEIEPIMDWVLSVRGAKAVFTPNTIAQLRQLLLAKLQERGVINITKTNGMFIAKA